jgi:hypothetical protein
VGGIPEHWRSKLALLPLLTVFADELYSLSKALASSGADTAAASGRYVLLQKVYGYLENGWLAVQRKLLPGPRMYSSVQAFADDMSALRSGYDEHASSITATDEVPDPSRIFLRMLS